MAARLARRLALPYIPTDPVYWTGDWRPAPAGEVRAWAESATSPEAWVLDGNFDAERELVWGRAELAVWLDFSLATTLWRVSRRNFRWWLSGEPVWGGQRMTLAKAWGGVRHTLRSHAGKRGAYPSLLAGFANLEVVRLTSPRAAETWLAGL
ncbi:MAG TPA: hypothetical protein VHZ26_05210 [Caulobacteraceae bacterium]|nr:hypothetical protein [Caulobacteraceae bacterium]